MLCGVRPSFASSPLGTSTLTTTGPLAPDDCDFGHVLEDAFIRRARLASKRESKKRVDDDVVFEQRKEFLLSTRKRSVFLEKPRARRLARVAGAAPNNFSFFQEDFCCVSKSLLLLLVAIASSVSFGCHTSTCQQPLCARCFAATSPSPPLFPGPHNTTTVKGVVAFFFFFFFFFFAIVHATSSWRTSATANPASSISCSMDHPCGGCSRPPSPRVVVVVVLISAASMLDAVSASSTSSSNEMLRAQKCVNGVGVLTVLLRGVVKVDRMKRLLFRRRKPPLPAEGTTLKWTTMICAVFWPSV